MTSDAKPQVIAIEEHYLDDEVAKISAGGPPHISAKLADLGEVRLQEMDDAGVDIQVLSHCPPGAQAYGKNEAAEKAQSINDRLNDVVTGNPERFSAFATLPTQDPDGSAKELDRCVNELGFKGAMLHGLTDGKFHDEEEFWPIFDRAAALDVPIYVHPGFPHPEVIKLYYGKYAEQYPPIVQAGWGFTVETATAAIRLVLSGIFDKHPNLKIILGHLGEGLPFLLWRINMAFETMGRPDVPAVRFRETFSKHFYITTSGNFSDPALLCTIQEMSVDRVLFSIDWPYVPNTPGTAWMDQLMLNQEDKEKILNGNAKRLLKM
ncbi:MAG: amidohydrolase family protein [Alphaproteobacteria bacterium]